MKIQVLPCSLFFALVSQTTTIVEAESASADQYWPAWRGPVATGVAPHADPPLEWGETKNVKWKVKIPGRGTSTPVIWGDKVFILSAIAAEKKAEPAVAAAPAPDSTTNTNAQADAGARRRGGGFGRGEKPTEKHQFVVLCLDRVSGKVLWQRTAREEVPHEGHHQDHGFASASPVTDGNLVIAYFGSRGLHCYDMDGNLKWSKDFGHMITRNGFGEGASPTLHGDAVFISWDDETQNDFIVALSKKDGNELWRTPRNEPTGWTTPLVIEKDKKLQVVVNAKTIRSYDFASGKEIWSCSGMTDNAIPCLVNDADTLYAISGFRGAALLGIKLGRTGDLTGTDAIRWSYNKSTPYVPSPLLAGNRLYFLAGNTGKLSCFDTREGRGLFEAEQLEGVFGVYASPVAAKDRVYVLGREGRTIVLKQSDKLEVLANNKLDERTDASIALAGRELFIRGQENLYCIAEN